MYEYSFRDFLGLVAFNAFKKKITILVKKL